MCRDRVRLTVAVLGLGLIVSGLILAGSTPQSDTYYHQRYMDGNGAFVATMDTRVFMSMSGPANATHALVVLDETARYLEEHGALLVDVARVDGGKTGASVRYRIVAVDADMPDGWTNVWLVRYG